MPARMQTACFLVLLAFLGARGFELFRSQQRRSAAVELEPQPREFHITGTDLALDMALLWLDRGSIDEALLVAASTPLAPGKNIDLRLSFDASDARAADRFSSFGSRPRPVSARAAFAETRYLPHDWERPQIQLHVTGKHAPQVAGIHALPLVLGYDVSLYGPNGGGRSAGPEDANLLLPTGGVAALRSFDGNFLLLAGVRYQDEPFEANRKNAWRDRLLKSLDLELPAESAVLDALAAAPRDVRFRSWQRVDPVLELAVAGVALADSDLCDRASAEVTGSLDDRRARADRSHTILDEVPEFFRRIEDTPRRTTTQAAWTACGVIPFDDLTEERARNWLLTQESPLRTFAVSRDPALLAAVVDSRVESRVGNDLHRYVEGALANPMLGRTDAARAEWRRLREDWLARGGWGMRLLALGGFAALAWVFLPWILGLTLVFLPARRARSEPRLSRGAVVGLLLLSVLTVGELELVLFATPLWWWLGRRWLVSGRRPLFDRLLVFLLVGSTGEVLGYRLRVTGIWGGLAEWTAAAQCFGFFFLGRIFLAQERVWHVGAWTVVLALLVLAWPAHDAGTPGWIVWIAIVAALAMFFRGSRGGAALAALPA